MVLMSDIWFFLKVSERSWIQLGNGTEYWNVQPSNTFYTSTDITIPHGRLASGKGA